MQISIFTTNSSKAEYIKSLIEDECFKYGHIINDENPDIIFYIGGDGTFLRAVQNNIDRLEHVMFVGINSGTLGYFYDADYNDVKDIFARLNNNALIEHKIPLLVGNAIKGEENVEFYAVNEIQIVSPMTSLRSEVSINEEYFQRYVGSGLIISSPYGSTGINKSYNGPVLMSDLACMSITPIGPINNNVYHSFNSSLIVNKDDVIRIYNNIKNATIYFDNDKLDDDYDELIVSTSSLYARVLFRDKRNNLIPLRRSFL